MDDQEDATKNAELKEKKKDPRLARNMKNKSQRSSTPSDTAPNKSIYRRKRRF
jgi:hypothetical protein